MSDHPAAAASPIDGRRAWHPAAQFARSLVSACPYLLAARALGRWGRIILGRGEPKEAVAARRLVDGVKMGRNIALIGLLCPFFWVALFSGADAARVRFNAIHSGGVVLVGLAWMVKSLVQIERVRRRDQRE